MQGLISQFAIPVLEGQTVWVSGVPTPIAYINTQDMARFAVAALTRPQTIRQEFPVVGPRAWTTGEITQLCERLSGKEARVVRVPPVFLAVMRSVASFFDASVNIAERLAFDRVTGGGEPLDALMETSYEAFGLNQADTTSLESYLKEYYDTILKRLRDMEADLDRDAKKKLPF
jgi:nucleoside-diphosphate-sugar epimerase